MGSGGQPVWPWWPGFNFTLPSGDVTQDLLRNWFSPTLEVNLAGNREIEAEVVEKVASYGKQLGILSEALLEAAGDKKGPALDRLRALADDIDAVKAKHQGDLLRDAERALDSLKAADRAAYDGLISSRR